MPKFNYRARDANGQLRIGERSALSDEVLNQQLIHEGIYPLEIKEIHTHSFYDISNLKFFFSKAQINNDLLIFSRQMRLLYQAGVPINDGLRQLAKTSRSTLFTAALNSLATQVEKGQSLSTAMQGHPKIFSSMICNIIKVGEASGKLGEAFGFLFDYLEFDHKNIKEIKSIFRYPAFVIMTILSAFFTLNVYVIPTFAKMYQGLNTNLPWETEFLIMTSNFFVKYSYLLTGFLIVLLFYFYKYSKSPAGRLKLHRILLKLPVFGSIITRLTLVRFSKLMAITLEAGVSLSECLQLVKEAINNVFIQQQINSMILEINRGVSFGNTLMQSDIFSSFELQILQVGEQSGDLIPALNYICEYHLQELNYDIKRIQDLIGPVLISITAVFVLIMALGIYLPIWNMINLVK